MELITDFSSRRAFRNSGGSSGRWTGSTASSSVRSMTKHCYNRFSPPMLVISSGDRRFSGDPQLRDIDDFIIFSKRTTNTRFFRGIAETWRARVRFSNRYYDEFLVINVSPRNM